MPRSAYIIILILLFGCSDSFAQKEAYNWYFGENAAITFNTVPPTSLVGSAIITQEGCASISDDAGNLLFYTDGITAWDSTNTIMPNGAGLLGNNSSTQSAVIVPKPANPGEYYLFAIGDFSSPDGLTYSEVDMSLNAGLGDVVAATKNTSLITKVAEKLTAVQHSNGTDIWVITHEINSDSFYCYLVTPAGVNPNPVRSKTGPITSATNIGYLKASPNGKYLAMAYRSNNMIGLFDFDNSSGTVSHNVDINYSGATYGVEFSPNSQLLYSAVSSNVYQYDLLAANIPLSEIIVGNSPSSPWALQLGPDNKIYLVKFNVGDLDVIDEPNVLGLGCNFIPSAVILNSGLGRLGLPTFIQSFFLAANFTYDGICIGDTSFFTNLVPDVDSLRWDFGDPASGLLNTSTDSNTFHIFSDTGTFEVTITVYDSILTGVSSQFITILKPFVDIGNDTTLCRGNTIVLDGTTQNALYLWNNNSTNAQLTTYGPGYYWLEITLDSSCTYRDSILLNEFDTIPIQNVDTTVCEEVPFILDLSIPGLSYLWSDGVVSSTRTFTSEADLTLTISNQCESVIDTVKVQLENCVCDVAIPEAFTPNMDGLNDKFEAIANCNLLAKTLRIYDRWGNMVYESINSDGSWNGSSAGEPMPVGNYVYYLQFTTDDDMQQRFLHGVVSLYR